MAQKVQDALGHQLQQMQPRKALHKYRRVREDNRDGSWSGSLRVRLDSPDQAEQIHQQLHGFPVLVEHDWCTLNVYSHLSPAFSLQPLLAGVHRKPKRFEGGP